MSKKMMAPNTTIWWVPLSPGFANPAAPLATELAAGTNISGAITTGYKLEAMAPDLDKSTTIIDEGNIETPTIGNYEAELKLFRDDFGGAGIAAPVASLGTEATTGGTFAATGSYSWYVVASTAKGDSFVSNKVTANISATTDTQVVNWTCPAPSASVTGFKVYRVNPDGSQVLVDTITGNTTLTFTDTGVVGTAGSPANPATVFTTALNLFQAGPVQGWLVSRQGSKSTVAPASGQQVSLFKVESDWCLTEDGAKGTPIQSTIPFFPLGEYHLNVALS